jgi:hypothetical protein
MVTFEFSPENITFCMQHHTNGKKSWRYYFCSNLCIFPQHTTLTSINYVLHLQSREIQAFLIDLKLSVPNECNICPHFDTKHPEIAILDVSERQIKALNLLIRKGRSAWDALCNTSIEAPQCGAERF